MKQPGKGVIWPANMNSLKTVARGRKIIKEYCIKSPKLNEISMAAEQLGLKFEIIKESARSDSWWENTGNLVVEKQGSSKKTLLLKLTEQIKKNRAIKK
ncbi:MAG: signal recognition particle protein Srp19 [Candidatus Bathyarchaeota archaeon]|nr:signal recognition particle protein Srp19 [Candidatus Bathyarchaeota archaeon]